MKSFNLPQNILLMFLTLLIGGCSEMSQPNDSATAPPVNKDGVNAITQHFSAEIEKKCPCELPENETDPKYVLSNEDKSAIEELKTVIKDQNRDTYDVKKRVVDSYQELHAAGIYETGFTAEQYMLNSVTTSAEVVADIPTDSLKAMRYGITAEIYIKDRLIKEFNKEMESGFLKFCTTEIKALVLIRKSIIDELLKR